MHNLGQSIQVTRPFVTSNPTSHIKQEFVEVYHHVGSPETSSGDQGRNRDKQLPSFPGPSWNLTGCIIKETDNRTGKNVVTETFIPADGISQLSSYLSNIEDQLAGAKTVEMRRREATA